MSGDGAESQGDRWDTERGPRTRTLHRETWMGDSDQVHPGRLRPGQAAVLVCPSASPPSSSRLSSRRGPVCSPGMSSVCLQVPQQTFGRTHDRFDGGSVSSLRKGPGGKYVRRCQPQRLSQPLSPAVVSNDAGQHVLHGFSSRRDWPA